MSRIRAGIPFLAAALALGALGPASAHTHLGSRYGGTLVVGLSAGDADTLDPTLSRTGASLVIYGAICQGLYERDAKQQLRPLLAAAVPSLSKDKLSYTIQLRKGVEFNDGTPFNAQAVVTTVQRFIAYPGSARASEYAGVDSVTASGPYTVVFHLKARDSTFTGNPWVMSPTQLAKLGDNFGTNPVCVGPYMFDHRVAGDHITVIKLPYYYDQKDVYLDKIVFKPMPDAPAAIAALKAGDIHALDAVSSTEVAAVRQTSSLRVIQAYRLSWGGITINIGNKNGAGNPPYTNVRTPLASSAKLRLAFEEAIDRTTLARVVFDGLVRPNCTPIPPANIAWYEATKVPCTPYDPKDAKKLVAASGLSNPTVHLLVRNTTDDLRLAQFIQAQETAVGINVVIDSTDNVTRLARAASGSFETTLGGNSPGLPDPSGNIHSFVTTLGVRNYSGYSNPRLDLILSNGLKATSTQARLTLYHVAQQIIASDRPIIYLYNPLTSAAFSTNLTGVQLNASGQIRVENARFK